MTSTSNLFVIIINIILCADFFFFLSNSPEFALLQTVVRVSCAVTDTAAACHLWPPDPGQVSHYSPRTTKKPRDKTTCGDGQGPRHRGRSRRSRIAPVRTTIRLSEANCIGSIDDSTSTGGNS
ncbi:hypothetical protein F2P81_022153 [Scophthalmus maximus]|uniref:Uncharacterized protein n=1 Tax=Scophthalmus maximus TaxID=52904 RepID=A0A6A4S1M5_SCOMX|nr:hypothetical protein F2P81_022153 [Scophthalmus maximus]